ncbi:MAG: hypothetical protein NT128_06465 [Proteobacteria bacterium]|nr:hypothetical protein [Pseudomonadota bacterium]
MILKYTFFALVTGMGIAGLFGSSSEHHNTGLGIVEEAVARNPVASDHIIEMGKLDAQKQRGAHTHLGKAKSTEIIGLLEQDHEDNVKDLIKYRWCFRKCANFTEAIGNGLLYLGSGLATVAGGVKLVGSDDVSNILLFASTICFASHVTLIGCAKCSSREERERENQLDKLAEAVGFSVTSLDCPIVDDDDGKGPAHNTALAKIV